MRNPSWRLETEADARSYTSSVRKQGIVYVDERLEEFIECPCFTHVFMGENPIFQAYDPQPCSRSPGREATSRETGCRYCIVIRTLLSTDTRTVHIITRKANRRGPSVQVSTS